PFESAGPATPMIVALRDRLEAGLVQGEPGFAVVIGKGHRHERLGTGITRSVVCDVGQDKPFGRNELTVDAMLSNDASAGRAHQTRPAAALSDVHPSGNRGKAARSPPRLRGSGSA